MKTAWAPILAAALLVGTQFLYAHGKDAQSTQRAEQKKTKEQVYDGNWWLATFSDERAAFLDGAADCLSSVAHAKWLTHSLPQLEEKITEYYKAKPEDRGMLVADVWRKLLSKHRPTKPTPGGEVWTGPHGYYDGEFWRQSSGSEQLGFLKGYFWCMRSCVTRPSETYSQSADYYADKIWDYVQAHPKTAYDEAIADILSRFRDQKKPR